MQRKYIIAIVVIILLIVVPVLIYRVRTNQQSTRYITAAASKGTLISTVSGTGNVIASNSVKVSPSITGTVANLSVNLGDQVKKGQTLFTIVNDSLQVTADKAYTSYLQTKQALTTAQAGLVTAQANATNQNQDSGQAKAQASLDAAQAQLAQDQQTLNSTDSGAGNYSSLQQKVASDQGNVTAATIALQQAQVTGAANAKAANLQLSAAEQAVSIAQRNVDNALADYNNQKANADQRTVAAPIDGTITTLSIGNGDQIGGGAGGSGSGTGSTAPVVIDDLSSLEASVQVNEVDAPNVQTGQKVSMTFDAIDGLTLTGKVVKIDTVGTVSSGVVTYGATISFDSLDGRVRPGMSVSADITTAVKQDVLMVPNSAVKSDSNGNSYVEILKNGSPVQQAVQTGAGNDTDT
ncbi:efflux RND transporter periplasmic adaptor subunit, partial [Patescibacteria group bacterium]|nr:efflux RND transporter periplasmic adaptor subunit [Patescibacteria group bacterium]